ncbi:MAG: hypothetical protein M1826_001508 [Phylliscum demangeonii]|nr:MAG: hypothetical protein M1826_001508 [Phylliscum demangeonii]
MARASSPSSSGSEAAGAAGKRKRAPTVPTSAALSKASSTADLLQPSSRDASGEDAAGSAVNEAVSTGADSGKAKKAATSAAEPIHPPVKRPRKSSTSDRPPHAPAVSDRMMPPPPPAMADGHGPGKEEEDEADPGEPSDTTEASVDIARKSKSRSKTSKTMGSKGHEDDHHRHHGHGGDGSKTVDGSARGRRRPSQTMPPPVKAGLVDPVGYHTNPPPTDRTVRVYADGVFDLFHLGHMRQLEQAKKAFPDTYLLVGVTGDADTHQRKGLTVLSGAERAETVRHCKWVDEVIENCPWIVTPEFMEAHHIDYVAHDDLPYGADEGDDIYRPIKEQGKFLVTQRTEGVSTTGIITKIVRDYEQYIARQFKRGTSRQELNVSWLKKNELDLKRHVNELRDSIRQNWSATGQELGKEIRSFWQHSISAPDSPARAAAAAAAAGSSAVRGRSPLSLQHLARFEIPRLDMSAFASGSGGSGANGNGNGNDFAAGYVLGLIGGMTRTRRSHHHSHSDSPSKDQAGGLETSQPASPSESPDSRHDSDESASEDENQTADADPDGDISLRASAAVSGS